MNVSDKLTQVHIRLAKDRFVSTLKDMPDLSISAIIVLAVAGQKPQHDAPDGVSLTLDQKMNVVCHQAVGVKIERQLLLKSREKRETFLEVLVRVKDVLAVIPSGDDVIKPALEFNPSLSCHDPAVLCAQS